MRIYLFILMGLLSSCSFFERDNKQEAVARVEDKYLLFSEIQDIAPKDVSKEDSALIVSNYIQNWVKEKLILNRAELNLADQQKNFKKQLEDYRASLIIYSYEKALIQQKLDTNVNEEEIKSFYEENKPNFELKDDIVKVRYLKVSKNAPKIKKIQKIYNSDKEDDIIELKEYGHQYAEKFHFLDDRWILFDELVKEVPIRINEREKLLKDQKHLEVEDSLSYYFVYIKGRRIKSELSPLSFERKNIKSIILNKRKLSLINTIKTELYQDALYKKDIEIYDLTKNK